MTQFETMGISPSILQAITELGYAAPSSIQAQTIPEIINGKDALVQTDVSQTLSFAISLIQKSDTEVRGVQGLVITHSPERCTAITDEIKRLAKENPEIRVVAVSGGQPIDKQIPDLREVPHIVVGTPARLLEHLDRGTIRLYHIRLSILDNADDLVGMGFQDEIEDILDQIPSGRQMAIFAKTMPPKVISMANEYLKTPLWVDVQPIEEPVVPEKVIPETTTTDTADDKIETLIKTLKTTIEEGGLDTYSEMLDRISETLNPRVMTTALLKLYFGNRPSINPVGANTILETSTLSFTREDLDQASIRPGKVRLMLNVGRRDGVSVKEVLSLFAAETGLTSYFLGDIVLGDTATYVDIPEDKIAVVFQGLNGILHNETPLAVRLVHKIRDAAQLQRDMAEQRSRRPDTKRFEGGDRRPQKNRRPQHNNHQRQPKNADHQAPKVDTSSTPIAADATQLPPRDRKPRERQQRSENYRKPTSGLPPYFPASSSGLGTSRHFDS